MGESGCEAKAIIQALITKAKKGDVRAAEIILDRTFGKAKQGIDIKATIQGSGFDYTRMDVKDLEIITSLFNKYEHTDGEQETT
jgi:hypothetical protein